MKKNKKKGYIIFGLIWMIIGACAIYIYFKPTSSKVNEYKENLIYIRLEKPKLIESQLYDAPFSVRKQYLIYDEKIKKYFAFEYYTDSRSYHGATIRDNPSPMVAIVNKLEYEKRGSENYPIAVFNYKYMDEESLIYDAMTFDAQIKQHLRFGLDAKYKKAVKKSDIWDYICILSCALLIIIICIRLKIRT